MTSLREDEAAISAAKNCAFVAGELLEFSREGESCSIRAFDNEDASEMLADALRTTMQIDLERELRRSDQHERAPMLRDVIVVLDRFLEGYA